MLSSIESSRVLTAPSWIGRDGEAWIVVPGGTRCSCMSRARTPFRLVPKVFFGAGGTLGAERRARRGELCGGAAMPFVLHGVLPDAEPFRSSTLRRNRPVWLSSRAAICSGVPVATR